MSGIHVGGSESEWRKCRPGRTQKLSYILESKQFMDVTFLVGNASNAETISSHRLVLSMYSSVFEAMFQGPLAASRDEVIELPDIEPQAFHVLLKFVYTGEFDRELSVENALGVLYVARKYDVTDLELVCTDCLKSQISSDNAVSILQTAQLLDVNDLKEDSLSFIVRNFHHVCKTEDFLNITKDNLKMLVKNDETRGAELDIFHGVLRWSVAESSRQGLEECPTSYRKVIEDILPLIRFPIMEINNIALQVVPSGVLTPNESTLLFQHMVVSIENRNLLPDLPFVSKKRSCSTYIARFYDAMAKTAYVDISAGWFNKFSVDQPVSIVSFGFYGPHGAEAASYEIRIKLMRDTNDPEGILGETFQTVIAKMRDVFHVRFPNPVQIFPGNNYRAWFSLKGPLTCHGTSTAPVQEVCVPVDFVHHCQVKFTYCVTGAHQLPEIGFQI